MRQNIRKISLPEGEIIPLKYDFMFTKIFNDPNNIEIVEGFVSSYLGLSLKEVHGKIKVKSRNLMITNKKDADNEVDLLLELDDNKKMNIEISTDVSQGIKDRNVVFLSKIHSRNLEYGMNDYSLIYPSIQINLVAHKINKKDLIEEYYLRNESGDILTEKFRIDYIDMEKAKNVCYNDGKKEKIRKWCEIIMLNKKEELKEALRESNIMSEKAKKRLSEDVEKLSSDKDAMIIYTKLSKWEMEHNTIMKEAKEEKEYYRNLIEKEKIKIKESEKKLQENEKKIKEDEKKLKEDEKKLKQDKKNLKENEEKIKENEKINIASNLLEMNISIEDISNATGLPINKIQNLK